MRQKPAVLYPSVVIFPALMPAMMLPLIHHFHLSALIVGLVMGVPIGLSLVGMGRLVKAQGRMICRIDGRSAQQMIHRNLNPGVDEP